MAKEYKPLLWLCLSFNKVFLGWVNGRDLKEAQRNLATTEQGVSIYAEPVFFLVRAGETECIQVKPDDYHPFTLKRAEPAK